IGTSLSIDGACAHAFAHIIYKGLLFMAMGAVLLQVGTTKASELGGLHRKMPYTTVFCIIGAASISAFPLLSGFAAKSLIASSAAYGGYTAVTFVLLFASAGVMEHSGIKIPYFAFFAHDGGHENVKEAPWNMLAAMAIAAALCIGIGVAPQFLYNLLPGGAMYSAHGEAEHMYNAYSFGHILTQFQLLLFAALAFAILMRSGIYPEEKRATNLDFDWVYRRLVPSILKGTYHLLRDMFTPMIQVFQEKSEAIASSVGVALSPQNERLNRSSPSGTAALWAALLLACFMMLYMM
ncbi:MAG: proton-conducting transporter membrane subunit, partial [Myxococcota bacterium]|nr:proton-conducting transporter membrane subunit [Myxococcota bacterium]